MSATKSRKVFALVEGAHCEVTIVVHNLDDAQADGIVQRVHKAAVEACADVTALLNQRDKTEAEERAERLRALMDIVDPQERVISHGTAERHNKVQALTIDANPNIGQAKTKRAK